MARNAYPHEEHFPKQLETLPHMMQTYLRQVPELTYLGISKFLLDKWIPLRHQMSSQIQADVRAVLGEEESPSREIATKLSSIEQLLALQISHAEQGGGSIERLFLQVQALSAVLEPLTNSEVGKGPAPSTYDAGLQAIDERIESLRSLIKSFGEGNFNNGRHQQLGKGVVDSIANAVTQELGRNGATKIEVRCVCGVGGVESRRPSTRSRKGQKKSLVFCEGCQAWHHGICVGYNVPAHYSCTASKKP